MPQKHLTQQGTFHINTVSHDRKPWCTLPGIPELLIDNLCMTRSVHRAELFAFCILPDHIHMVIRPGPSGMSKFMQSFKRQSSRDIGKLLGTIGPFWQKGYFDERLKNATQRSNALGYVRSNAFKHNLVIEPEAWLWSSFHFPEKLDELDPWLD